MLRITVHQREDYTANVTGDTRVWEAGRSEAEAIGKLMISLDAAARANRSTAIQRAGIHGKKVLGWLLPGPVRVERV